MVWFENKELWTISNIELAIPVLAALKTCHSDGNVAVKVHQCITNKYKTQARNRVSQNYQLQYVVNTQGQT